MKNPIPHNGKSGESGNDDHYTIVITWLRTKNKRNKTAAQWPK